MSEMSQEPTVNDLVIPTFVTRIGKMSLVESAMTKAQSFYQHYGKENNLTIVKQTCGLMEDHLGALRRQAAPVVQQHADKVARLDEVVNAQIDRVERMATGLSSLPSSMTTAVVNSQTLNQAEKRICNVTSSALATANSIVDSVMPAAEKEDADVEDDDTSKEDVAQDSDAAPPVLGTHALRLLKRARTVSTKVQMRAYAQALKQLHQVQTRSEEVAQAMKPYTVDLLAYAREHLDQIANGDVEPAEEPEHEHVFEQELGQDGVSSVTIKTDSVLNNLAVSLENNRKRAVRQAARLARFGLDTASNTAAMTYHASQAGIAIAAATPVMAIEAADDAVKSIKQMFVAQEEPSQELQNAQDQTVARPTRGVIPTETIYNVTVAVRDYAQPWITHAETFTIVRRAEETTTHVYDYLLTYPQFRMVHDPATSWLNDASTWFLPAPHEQPETYAEAVKEDLDEEDMEQPIHV